MEQTLTPFEGEAGFFIAGYRFETEPRFLVDPGEEFITIVSPAAGFGGDITGLNNIERFKLFRADREGRDCSVHGNFSEATTFGQPFT